VAHLEQPKPKSQPRKPKNYWKNPQNQQKFLEDVYSDLQFTKLEDWYQVTAEKLLERPGGPSILRVFGFSPLKLLEAVYTHHKWDPFKFKKSPQNIWTDNSNAKRLMDEIGQRLGVASPKDWYSISREQVAEHGGLSLLLRHSNSFYETLSAVYPEHTFEGWRFKTVPRGYWTTPPNRRSFLEEAMTLLRLPSMESWYHVQQSQITEIGGASPEMQHYSLSPNIRISGAGLLAHFKGKPSLAIMDSFPEHDWEPWRFSRTISGFWKVHDNRVRYFDWLAKRLRLASKDDWYSVSVADVRAQDGAGILHLYHDSLEAALTSAYPNHAWARWKFQATSAVD
jgi:hypothetical protein